MSRRARRDGSVRRHILVVHDRMKAEVAIRALGHTPTGWRDGKPVVRIQTPRQAHS